MRKGLNGHTKKSELGFTAPPEQPLAPGAGKASASSGSRQRDRAGRDFGGVCFLLLSQQLWPKLFAIKQHVAASQESLLAHPRYVLATCSSKASSTPGASVSRAPRRASSLRGKQGKNSGQHRQADRCLLRRWLEDLEQSCHTSVSPAQTFSFCPGTSSQRKKKRCEPFVWDVEAPGSWAGAGAQGGEQMSRDLVKWSLCMCS